MSAILVADKLRASLLQAAIQGKLTEQLPEDGDARDLLKAIQIEKERLIKEGSLKKENLCQLSIQMKSLLIFLSLGCG